MACLRSTWQMTASLPLLPAADDFDRPVSLHVNFQELTQVWAIACWFISLSHFSHIVIFYS